MRGASAPREPLPTLLQEERQGQSDLLGTVDTELGEGVSRPDLDADIGAVQVPEGLLVGDVVAEKDCGSRRFLMTEDIEGDALVGDDDGELDHGLAFGDLNPVPRSRAGTHGRECLLTGRGLGIAYVQRDTGGLGLDADAGVAVGDVLQFTGDDGEELLGVVVDGVDEPGVELAAVAAHELHLRGQPRENREITKRAAGDDSGVGAVE
ncbi:putative uncharacterized protein [Rhodococcus sp. AW25M09]|nr:putative uncharacterized protein [Rhodococcus sp. AW25M09]